MTHLICEGACNGSDVQKFDAVVRKALDSFPARNTSKIKPAAWVSTDWIDRARKFIHTRHEDVGRTHNGTQWELWYRCLECGTKRVYGRERTWEKDEA